MSEPGWVLVWAMPNVTLDAPIEASHVALVPSNDERLLAIARRKPALATFLGAFRNEFETWVSPTIGLVREDARKGVFTVTAFGGFRDAVCVSAIVAGQAHTIERNSTQGIIYSDAFDVYPWFLNPQMDGRISATTPALIGMHTVADIRPRSAPALGNRTYPGFISTNRCWARSLRVGSDASRPARRVSKIEGCFALSIWLAPPPRLRAGQTRPNMTPVALWRFG
jgi:hypothetical protein